MSAHSNSSLYPASVSSLQAPPQAAGLSPAHGGRLCGAGADARRQDGCHDNSHTDGKLHSCREGVTLTWQLPLQTTILDEPVAQGQAAADLSAAPCRCKQSCRAPQSCLPASWSLCTSTRHVCCQAGKSLSRCAVKPQAPPCRSALSVTMSGSRCTHGTGYISELTAQATVLSWWDLPKHFLQCLRCRSERSSGIVQTYSMATACA